MEPSFSRKVLTAARADTVHHTCITMKHAYTSAVIVCGEGSRVEGIFTEHDVAKAVARGVDPLTTPIGSLMTSNPTCVTVECDDPTAMRTMAAGRYRHLPVVATQESRALVGLHDSLQLGKSLLQAGSQGMMARAKTFLKVRRRISTVACRTVANVLCACVFACVVCMCVWYQRFISQGREANSELQSSVQAVFGLESMVMAAACDTTVSDAMALMASQNSSALLVKGVGAVKGIFTERDLCVHCANVWRLCAD